MPLFGFKIDKIYLIESLPENEKSDRDGKLMSSGDYYHEILLSYHDKISRRGGIEHELQKCCTPSELLHCLNKICAEVRNNGWSPLIHFEIHGTEDNSGITLANGESVKWKIVIDELTKINIESANNLLVIFATCSGVYNLHHVKPRNSAFPYYSMIAPDNIDFPILLEERLTEFYLRLFSGEDFMDNIHKLEEAGRYSNLRFSTCEQILYRAIQNVLFTSDEVRKKYGLARLLGTDDILPSSNNAVVPSGRLLNLGNYLLERYKESYLLSNDPRNVGRFTMTIDELVQDGKRRFGLQ